MLRRLVVCMLLAWLPLQGLAATTMPFCRHPVDTAVTEHAAHAQTQTHRHAHHGHERGDEHGAAAHPSGSADHHGGLTCNDCGSCHLACAAAMLSQPASRAVVAVTGGPFVPPLLAPPAVVLDQPNPPPLSRG